MKIYQIDYDDEDIKADVADNSEVKAEDIPF